MELFDQYLRKIEYLRVSVTDRCDLRCVYCMKEKMNFLPKNEVLRKCEITELRIYFGCISWKKEHYTSADLSSSIVLHPENAAQIILAREWKL